MKHSQLLKTSLIVCFCLFLQTAFGQQREIDSFNKVLSKAKMDTNRVKIETGLAQCLKNPNPEESIKAGESALALAEKLKWQKGIAISTFVIGEAYANRGDFHKAIGNCKKSLEIARSIQDKYLEANYLGKVGIINFAMGNFNEAITYCQDALKISVPLNLKYEQAKVYRYLAVIYLEGNKLKSLEYNLLALKMTREIGDKSDIARNLSNLGMIYRNLDDSKKSLENYYEALKIYEDLGEIKGKANVYSGLATVYSKEKQYSKALFYHNKEMEIYRILKDLNGESVCQEQIGGIYLDISNFEKARICLDSAYLLEKITGNKYFQTSTLNLLGKLYLKLGQYSTSIEYLNKGLQFANEVGGLDLQKNVWQTFSETYEKMHQSDKALVAYKTYIELRDSSLNIETKKEFTRKTMQYDFDIKEAATKANFEKTQAIAQSEIKAGKFQRNAFIGGGVMFLLLSLVTFGRYRAENKSKKLIEAEKEKTEEKSLQLEETNAVKDKLFSIISHDLRSPLMSLEAFVQVIRQGKITEEKMEHLTSRLNDSLYTTLNLLENLLAWAKSKMKDSKLTFKTYKLEALVNENFALYENLASEKKITLVSNVSKDSEIWCDYNVASLILRNLVNNAIKFSNIGSEIVIEDLKDKTAQGFSVRDSGVGMPVELVAKLFKLNDENMRAGTKQEKGTGLGLSLCFELMQQIDGTITVESEPGKGSVFFVRFPLQKTIS